MGQTIAEALREEGKLEGSLKTKRQMLLQLLQHKFGPNVTPAMVAGVETTVDHRKLDEWFGQTRNAERLEEVDIP